MVKNEKNRLANSAQDLASMEPIATLSDIELQHAIGGTATNPIPGCPCKTCSPPPPDEI